MSLSKSLFVSGVIYTRPQHADGQEDRTFQGTMSALCALLVKLDTLECGCCGPAFRGVGGGAFVKADVFDGQISFTERGDE